MAGKGVHSAAKATPSRQAINSTSSAHEDWEITRHADSKTIPSEFLITTPTLASPLFVKAPSTFILM